MSATGTCRNRRWLGLWNRSAPPTSPPTGTSDKPFGSSQRGTDLTHFATKPQLTCRMLERVLAAGVPVAWVTGDTVYGHLCELRNWLEDRGLHPCTGSTPQRNRAGRHRRLARGRGACSPRANAKSVSGQCRGQEPGPVSDLPVMDNVRYRPDSPDPRDFAFALHAVHGDRE